VDVGNPHLDAKIKINLAVILLEQGQAAAANSVLLETLQICSENLLYDYLAESNLYLGKIAMSEGAFDRAIAYLEAGMQAAGKVNFRWAEAHLLAVQAELYARRADFEMALQAVREAQAIATADGFTDMLIQQHFAAAEYAAEMNDFATAYAEHKAGRAFEQRAATARLKNDFPEGPL
jgi:tetratricopeptide (TPR) repeat protein